MNKPKKVWAVVQAFFVFAAKSLTSCQIPPKKQKLFQQCVLIVGMDYEIKRGDTVVITVRPEGVVKEAIMAGDFVTFSFTLPQPVDFRIGDYVIVYRKRYQLNQLPVYEKEDSSGVLKYTYNLQFESEAYDLAKTGYYFLNENNEFKTVDFSLTGTADAFMDVLIRNTARNGGGWVKGVVDLTETKTLSFSGLNCLAALSTFAVEFDLEWWIIDKVIHLTKRAKTSGLTFEYGKGKGLYALRRQSVSNTNIVTRLIVEGGTRNIPGDYRNYSNRIKLPASAGWALEKNIDKYGIIEQSIIFEDVFPNRVGTVTNVVDPNTFSDSTLEFNVNNYLLPDGTSPKIVFNTGALAGYEFENASFNNITKTFVINDNKQEKALQVPSLTLKPARGDQYIVTEITLPQNYIDLAEMELQEKAQRYLDENSVPRVIYEVVPDPLHFKRSGIALTLGDYVHVVDEPLGVDINPRITAYERDLHEPHRYLSITLAEHVTLPPIVKQKVEQKVEQIKNKLDMSRFDKAGSVTVLGMQREIVFKTGYRAAPLGQVFGSVTASRPVYWKDLSNNVYLAGSFLQNNAGSPYSPFQLPAEFTPGQETTFPVYIDTLSGYAGQAMMRVTVTGEAFISAKRPDGSMVNGNEIKFVDLSGARFFIGARTYANKLPFLPSVLFG